MTLTKQQKKMLHYIKCKFLETELKKSMALRYPLKMDMHNYWYSKVNNKIRFLVYYSPLRNTSRRKWEWKTLQALEEKGYIVGFYITYYRRLKSLSAGVNDADDWNYWSKLKNRGNNGEEIDSGEIIVYLTPKGVETNTYNTKKEGSYYSHLFSMKKEWFEWLMKDGNFKKNYNPLIGKNPYYVDDLTRIVYADCGVPNLGIINKMRLEKTEEVNYENFKKSIEQELKEKRQMKFSRRG